MLDQRPQRGLDLHNWTHLLLLLLLVPLASMAQLLLWKTKTNRQGFSAISISVPQGKNTVDVQKYFQHNTTIITLEMWDTTITLNKDVLFSALNVNIDRYWHATDDIIHRLEFLEELVGVSVARYLCKFLSKKPFHRKNLSLMSHFVTITLNSWRCCTTMLTRQQWAAHNEHGGRRGGFQRVSGETKLQLDYGGSAS